MKFNIPFKPVYLPFSSVQEDPIIFCLVDQTEKSLKVLSSTERKLMNHSYSYQYPDFKRVVRRHQGDPNTRTAWRSISQPSSPPKVCTLDFEKFYNIVSGKERGCKENHPMG